MLLKVPIVARNEQLFVTSDTTEHASAYLIRIIKYLFPAQAPEKFFEQVHLATRKGIKKVIRLLSK